MRRMELASETRGVNVKWWSGVGCIVPHERKVEVRRFIRGGSGACVRETTLLEHALEVGKCKVGQAAQDRGATEICAEAR